MLTMNLEDFPDILTPYDVMGILGLGKNKVYALLNDGRLHGIRIGRSWRVTKKAINDFMEL